MNGGLDCGTPPNPYSSDSDSDVTSLSSSSSSSDVSFFLRDLVGTAFGRPLPRVAPFPASLPLTGAGGGGAGATFFAPLGRPRPRFKASAAAADADVPFSEASVVEGEILLCFDGGGVELAAPPPDEGDAARALFCKQGKREGHQGGEVESTDCVLSLQVRSMIERVKGG